MDKQSVIMMVSSLIASGFFGLVVGVFIYWLLPKALGKVSKYIDSDTMSKIEKGLHQLISIKSAMDTDPNHEDLVERILRYSELAVHAAEQAMKNKQGIEKKEYAVNLAMKLLQAYKTKTSPDNPEVNDFEKEIISGLIETVVSVQKKVISPVKPLEK